jgi:hypothetical protein
MNQSQSQNATTSTIRTTGMPIQAKRRVRRVAMECATMDGALSSAALINSFGAQYLVMPLASKLSGGAAMTQAAGQAQWTH